MTDPHRTALRHAGSDAGTGSRRRGGFTLIELVVVTVIVALVFALATTQMDWLIPKYELRGVARELGSVMKEARSRALATGKDVYVIYDISAKKYWILAPFPVEETDRDPDAPPAAVPKGYVYEAVFEKSLPASVSIKDVIVGRDRVEVNGQARVRMSPFGMSEHHIVNLYNESEQEVAVRFNGFTGRLTFYDEYRQPEEILEDTEP